MASFDSTSSASGGDTRAAMVAPSAMRKKKRKSKKRKPVNLQAGFNRKCNRRVDGGATASGDDAEEAASAAASISADMFPRNDAPDGSECNAPAIDSDRVDAAEASSVGDFHLHSVCSDGKLRPAEVVAKAAERGVVFMSLSDHDTMAGVAEALEAAQELGVLVVPGVEISTQVAGGESLHILGYFYPGTNSEELEVQLAKIRQARHKRGQEMLRKLDQMGIHLKWERVLEIAGEAAPGRPHIAQALVERGFVSNFREAFSRYLHNNGPAYAEGEDFPPEEAISLIAKAGGVSVLAHPWCCKNPLTLVPEMAKAGINGVEVYHDTTKIELFGGLADESNLLKLGGSDFHGIDPANERAPGEIPLPKKQIEDFLAYACRVWERPLSDRLNELSAIKSAEHSPVSSVLVLKQQVMAAQAYAKRELGRSLQVTEEEGHYARLSILQDDHSSSDVAMPLASELPMTSPEASLSSPTQSSARIRIETEA